MNKIFQVTNTFTKVKAVSTEVDAGAPDLIIEGFASTSQQDRSEDVILAEAWTKGGIDNYLKNPILLAYHNHTMPIGMSSELSVVEGLGLRIVATISAAAGNIYNLVKEGILKSFSVSFMIKDAEYNEIADIFVIKDLELLEISVVSVPDNPNTQFSVKKSFNSDNEFSDYKKSITADSAIEEIKMDKKDEINTDELIAKAVADALAKEKAREAEEARVKAAAEEKAKEKDAVFSAVSGVEKLLKDIEGRIEKNETDVSSTIEGLQNDLKEKAAELEAVQKSRMEFSDKNSGSILQEKDIDKAVLLGIITGKGVGGTAFGKDLIEKAGAHLNTGTVDWEQQFASRVQEAVKANLVVEPLFTNRITMNAPTMQIPVNPDSGDATWVTSANYNGGSIGAQTFAQLAASSGDDTAHQLTNITLTAHKLASKEFIGYEEEEDAIIPILPIIQAALTRKMARGMDLALLEGNGTTTPILGISNQIATPTTMGSAGTPSTKVTLANLRQLRADLGIYGANQNDLVYIVSTATYFDLLEDTNMQKYLDVQGNATLLTGEIARIGRIPVVVTNTGTAASGTKTAGDFAAACVNVNNFLFGELRGLRVERESSAVQQQRVIVATRRVGFTPISGGAGTALGLAIGTLAV